MANIYYLARQVLSFAKLTDPYEARDMTVKQVKDLLTEDRQVVIDNLKDCIENDFYTEEATELLNELVKN